MSKYASKKFFLICTGWALEVISLIWGVFHGFPKEQAQMVWNYMQMSYTPFLLVLTGWYFKKDVDEKKVLNGK